MPLVTFLPSRKTADVPAGTPLVEAATKAGIDMETPCGARGSCGKCVARVSSGKIEFTGRGVLSKAAISEGYIHACQATVGKEAVTIAIPEPIGKNGQFATQSEEIARLNHNLLPAAWQRYPITKKIRLTVPAPLAEDGLSDMNRLINRLKPETGGADITCSLPVIRKLADCLRKKEGEVTVTITSVFGDFRVIDIEGGDQTSSHLGLAIDIGTTTVSVMLVDLAHSKIIGVETDYNRQITRGVDVISRINFARKTDRLEELRTRGVDTINHLIDQARSRYGINGQPINTATISGNTTMIHLLLGLNPEHIRLEPYTPTLLDVPYLAASEIGLAIGDASPIFIAPAVGSYVGGDIVSGLLCTSLLTEPEEVSLFIDIGTNGEIAIGNRGFILTCACSAGPAFEGGGLRNGMRAAHGAIESVAIDPKTGMADYQTINNEKAKGICGSGIISLLAELFLTGWIDSAGKLDRSRPCDAIKTDGRQSRYLLSPESNSGIDQEIAISEKEIENVIRAKAAIYSACSLMLEQVGLTFENLSTVYIAGGFGKYLDLEKAITIGLLPDIPRHRFTYLGNASLMGAYMALISQEYQRKQIDLARRMTYMELSTTPDYMDQYTSALFLPHTDKERFPSINVNRVNDDIAR